MLKDNANRRALVLMSGGVDSSAAAALMQEQGYAVTGVIMKIWAGPPSEGKSPHHGCYGPEEEQDIQDARQVAASLGIPFQVIDLTREYQNVVLDYFSREYSCGRTPNPCVRCNHRIKFGALIEKTRELGLQFDFVASGHYARVEFKAERYLLKKALDLSKDQSYFLAFLSQQQLGQLVFPLGGYAKVEVRKIAARFGLKVADKPDSQNFFSGHYSSIFPDGLDQGPIIDKTGKTLGLHHGIRNYTIGQRKGLAVTAPAPLYVIDIDSAQNTLVVGDKKDIYQRKFLVSDLNWVSIPGLTAPAAFKVKIRSSHRESEAEVIPLDTGMLSVNFHEAQMAITPGQTAVFYHEDIVLGGGIIKEVNS